MLITTLTITAIFAYLGASAVLWFALRRGPAPGRWKLAALSLGLIGLGAHGGFLWHQLATPAGIDLGFFNAASLVALAVTALFALGSLRKPIESLGLLILPIAALTVALAVASPSHGTLLPTSSRILVIHIVVSLLAYSLLSIAVVQSLVLSLQERHLHEKQPGLLLRALPPLQTMETLLFQMIGLGFTLLTLTVVSGIFFSEAIFGQPLKLTHHIVLSLIAWVVFGILLFGRLRFGWRGRYAVRWAVGGFTVLALAYFGSKFILEYVVAGG